MKIPKDEKLWLTYTTKDNTYYTTAKLNDRSMYFAYKLDGKELIKLGKNRDPTALYKYFV